jgi:hypothetical protein
VGECQDHDLVADDLVRQREWEARQYRNSPIRAVLSLQRRVRHAHDHV